MVIRILTAMFLLLLSVAMGFFMSLMACVLGGIMYEVWSGKAALGRVLDSMVLFWWGWFSVMVFYEMRKEFL